MRLFIQIVVLSDRVRGAPTGRPSARPWVGHRACQVQRQMAGQGDTGCCNTKWQPPRLGKGLNLCTDLLRMCQVKP